MGLLSATREEQLRQTLVTKPRNARAMAKLACLLHEQGNTDEARAWAQKAEVTVPLKPFGCAARSLVEPELNVRIDALRRAIKLSSDAPEFSVARIGLLVRLLLEPRRDESVRLRGKIGKASKNHPSRRPLTKEEKNLHTEIESSIRTHFHSSSSACDASAKEQLSYIAGRQYKLGLFFRKVDTRQAAQYFQEAMRNLTIESTGNDDCNTYEMAEFWLATLQCDNDNALICDNDKGPCTMDRCPQSYVIGLYSTFAERFDDLLVQQLNYQTPSKLRQLVGSDRVFESAIDLGCGTGLSGAAFRSICRRMHGVDLSPEMIALAEQRGCYEELSTGDVESFLGTVVDESVNLVFACDVFCYLGNLQAVFAHAARVLRSNGGVFACSTELLDETSRSPFRLHECARFAHQKKYVEELALHSGFATVINSQVCAIRRNQGKDVSGFLIVLQKES